jgi:hypothetical protein
MRKKVPKGWVSISEFEALTGVENKTILAAIRRGAIPAKCAAQVATNGKTPYYLKPHAAAVSWHDTLSPSHPLSKSVKAKLAKYIKSAGSGGASEVVGVEPPKEPPKEDTEALPEVSGKSTKNVTYAEALRRKEVAKAAVAELEMKERYGELVQRKKVHEQLYTAGQELRNALLSVPDRITDNVIAAVDNRTNVYNIIYNAIASELEKLTSIGERIAQ